MSKSLFTIAVVSLLLVVMLITGCTPPGVVTATGPMITRQYDQTGFTSVDVSNAFEIEIVPSSVYSIAITANESLFEYIEVNKSGEKLYIGMKGISLNFRNPRLKAKVTMPELRGLNLSGATKADVRGFKTAYAFDLGVSGASSIDLDLETGALEAIISGASTVRGSLKAPNSDIVVTGASKIELDGSGGSARINASGASNAMLGNYPTGNTDVNLSGASKADVRVSGRLDIELSGASTLEYAGEPEMGDLNITGASQLKRK